MKSIVWGLLSNKDALFVVSSVVNKNKCLGDVCWSLYAAEKFVTI